MPTRTRTRRLVPLIPILRKLNACAGGVANLRRRRFRTFADLWVGLNDENARDDWYLPGWEDLEWLVYRVARTGVFPLSRVSAARNAADQAFTKERGNVFRAELAKRGITRQRVERALLDLA